jgi:predicted SAM-dependent methyltransferase
MKLQVGCGEVRGIYKRSEWVNIDLVKVSDDDGMEVLGNATKLPFKTNTFEEIHCIHVLEHVTRDKYPVMIREMCRVMKPGGLCYIETPDFKGTIDNVVSAFANNDVDAIHIWTTSVYGKSEREGMSHHWGFYEGLLRRVMRQQGFTDVDRLIGTDNMISMHYKGEPVLLVRGTK